MATTTTTTTATPPVAPRRRPLVYYGYWLVGVAMLAQFVAVGMQVYVSGVFLKPMTEELGWTRAEFSYAQTVGRFLMAFVGIFVGVYVDRYGGRVLMVVGVTILGASLFLTSAVTELWQWVLLRGAMFTVGGALMGNLVVNVTLSKWFVEKRGRVVGFAAMGTSLAGLSLPPLMTAISDEFGWRAGWRVLAVIAWLLVYPLAMLMRRRPEDYGLHPDGKSDEEIAAGQGAAAAADYANSLTRGEALRTPALYMIVLAFGLSGLTLGNIVLQAIPFLTDEGFDRRTAALMITVLAIPSVATKPFWGLLVDYIPPRYLASVSFAAGAVAQVIVVIGATAGSLPVVVASYALAGFGAGGMIPIQEVIWATYFGRRYLGAVRSVAMPFALLVGAGGPLAVSYYFDVVGDYLGAFYVLAGLSAVASLLILMTREPAKPGAERAGRPGPEAPAAHGPQRDEGAAAMPGAATAAGGDGAAPEELAPDAPRPAAPEVGPAPVRPRIPLRDYMRDR